MSELFYILSSTTNPDWIKDALRKVLFSICKGAFNLIEDVFNLFFQIVDFEAFGDGISESLFSRLFMIIGIFMFFKISISLITYLMNPEVIKDKERGIGKLFSRLIVMLVLLLLLMPWPSFNLWKDDTEKMTAEARNGLYQNNGLLFGLLYDAQKRIINDGTISKLILGNVNIGDGQSAMKNAGHVVSITILRAFAPLNENCSDKKIEAGEKIVFQNLDDIGNRIDERCDSKDGNGEYYLFDFSGFTAILVGLGTCVIVFLFTFDVAIRMIKLGILRILSPIPAISYIDPKSSRDGTFAAYIKTLTSTYLDLFLRLALIFLVIYLISIISQNDKGLFSTENGNPGGLAKAIIYISLLFFAGQAPKFIQQSLGIKSKGTGLGFGAALFGGALSGMISGAAYGGVWGGVQGFFGGANAGVQNQWAAQNGQRPNQSVAQAARDKGAQMVTHDRNTMGVSLTQELGGRIASGIMGITPTRLESSKNRMYELEGKVRTAHEDFYLNPENCDGKQWKELAAATKKRVDDAETNLARLKNQREELLAGGRRVSPTKLRAINEQISKVSGDLEKAKAWQADAYGRYVNHINATYGKQKKKYEQGFQYRKKRVARETTADDPKWKKDDPNSFRNQY